MMVGYFCSMYINWRVQIKTVFTRVRVNKNIQMGFSTAELVFIFVAACYTMMSL
jgi:hypothetical protein